MQARIHIPLIEGIYTGQARCYELDPPYKDANSGKECRYVSIAVQPGITNHQYPEVLIFAAEPQYGGVAGSSMMKLPGSGTLHFHPDDADDGWRYALIALGVSEIVDEFEKPKLEFPSGLDYDPDELPEGE
jgi:hypothetical protein